MKNQSFLRAVMARFGSIGLTINSVDQLSKLNLWVNQS